MNRINFALSCVEHGKNVHNPGAFIRTERFMTFVINSFPVPDQGGKGAGWAGTCPPPPPPPQDAVSALIKEIIIKRMI